MKVEIKTQCPHCRRPMTVRERIPAELPAVGDRVRLAGKLCVVTDATRHESPHGDDDGPERVSYKLEPLEG